MFDNNAKMESSWGTPLRVLVITLVFAIGFLYYYFGPSLNELQGNRPEASASELPITLSIGGRQFLIPENFTQFPRARRGGTRANVALYAMLPDLDPYTIATETIFENNEPDSPIVNFQLESVRSPLNETQKIEKIYMPKVVDREGERALYGLTHFRFVEGTGTQNQDLFLGEDDLGRTAAIVCDRNLQEIIPPSCRRMTDLTEGVVLNYRFKRSRLRDWKEIDGSVRTLALSFLDEGAQ